MKFLLFVALLSVGTVANASGKLENCTDQAFNGLPAGIHYSELKDRGRFSLVSEIDRTLAPAGFEVFGEGESICRAVGATYLRHNATKKMYVAMHTHDDGCDGGNTIGLIIDLEKYEFSTDINDSVVAEIGDGEVVCIKNQENK